MNRARQHKQYLLNILLGVLVCFFIQPLFLVLSISISSEQSITEYGYQFFPNELSLEAYDYILANISRIYLFYSRFRYCYHWWYIDCYFLDVIVCIRPFPQGLCISSFLHVLYIFYYAI